MNFFSRRPPNFPGSILSDDLGPPAPRSLPCAPQGTGPLRYKILPFCNAIHHSFRGPHYQSPFTNPWCHLLYTVIPCSTHMHPTTPHRLTGGDAYRNRDYLHVFVRGSFLEETPGDIARTCKLCWKALLPTPPRVRVLTLRIWVHTVGPSLSPCGHTNPGPSNRRDVGQVSHSEN